MMFHFLSLVRVSYIMMLFSDLPSSSESTTDHCTPPKTSPLQKICMHRGVQGTCRTAPCCIKPHLHQAPAYAPAGV